MQQDMREQTEASREKAAEKKRHLWLRYLPKIILGLGVLAVYFSWQDYHRKPSQKELDIALTRYMRGKYAIYGDTLTPKGEGSVTYLASDIFYSTSNTYELAFTSEKFPKKERKEEIVLDYDYEKNTLRDNYMSFVLRNQAEEKFREIFDRIYEPGTYELVMKVEAAPWRNLNPTAVETISQHLEHIPLSDISICVVRNSEMIEGDMRELLRMLKIEQYGVDGIAYYMDEEEYQNRNLKGNWMDEDPYSYKQYIIFAWEKNKSDFSIYTLREEK